MNRPLRALACALAAGLAGCATGPNPGPSAINEPGGRPAGYELVWTDEFDRDGLPDPARWAYDTARNRLGWWNNELQYYADGRVKNSRVERGALVIEAHREAFSAADKPDDHGGQAYTSARLVTRGRQSWTYGFFEIRARLPCGIGTWPAIWTLGDGGQWPADGEIDIMEHVGFSPGVVHGSVHTTLYHHTAGTHRTSTMTVGDACSAFHRYQLTWTPQRILIGVDDRNYYSYRNDGVGPASWPFDRPQHLLLNIAVGGSWGGARGVDERVFPVRMEVDHVRVWQARPGVGTR